MRIKEGQTLKTKDGAIVDAVEEMARFARIVLRTAIYRYCNDSDTVHAVMDAARREQSKLLTVWVEHIVEQVETCEDDYFGSGLISKWEDESDEPAPEVIRSLVDENDEELPV